VAEATDDDCVLDPSCARATPLFAARLGGLGSVGLDANPPDWSRHATQFSAPGNYAEGIDCYASSMRSPRRLARLVAGCTRPSPSSFQEVHDSEGCPSYSVTAELVWALAGQHQNRTTDAA